MSKISHTHTHIHIYIYILNCGHGWRLGCSSSKAQDIGSNQSIRWKPNLQFGFGKGKEIYTWSRLTIDIHRKRSVYFFPQRELLILNFPGKNNSFLSISHKPNGHYFSTSIFYHTQTLTCYLSCLSRSRSRVSCLTLIAYGWSHNTFNNQPISSQKLLRVKSTFYNVEDPSISRTRNPVDPHWAYDQCRVSAVAVENDLQR